jgi:hypothetical protein
MLYFVILILICVVLIFLLTQYFAILFRGYAPFISTRHELIQELAKIIVLKPGQTVYELGAGDAPLLLELSNKNKDCNYIGIEYSFLPWLIGNIQIKLHNSPVKLIKKNIFSAYLGKADIIYCYLNNKMMAALETKIPTECQPGTQIWSLSFPFPHLEPTKVLELSGQKVYFYTLANKITVDEALD